MSPDDETGSRLGCTFAVHIAATEPTIHGARCGAAREQESGKSRGGMRRAALNAVASPSLARPPALARARASYARDGMVAITIIR